MLSFQRQIFKRALTFFPTAFGLPAFILTVFFNVVRGIAVRTNFVATNVAVTCL